MAKSLKEIKRQYLYAWDRHMGSYEYWCDMQQEKAEKEGAPLNTVYYSQSLKEWVTFSDLNDEKQAEIEAYRRRIFEKEE